MTDRGWRVILTLLVFAVAGFVAHAQGTIQDLEPVTPAPPIATVEFSEDTFTVSESDGFVQLWVGYHTDEEIPDDLEVNITVSTSSTTATSSPATNGGQDYTNVDKKYILRGDYLIQIIVGITGDPIPEPTEIVFVNLAVVSSSTPVTVTTPKAIITILDDDVAGVIGFQDDNVTVSESAGVVSLFVSYESQEDFQDTAESVQVSISTISETALEGSDYIGVDFNYSTNFDDDDLIRIDIVLIDDEIHEPNENFIVILTALETSVSVIFSTQIAIVTILDDDVQDASGECLSEGVDLKDIELICQSSCYSDCCEVKQSNPIATTDVYKVRYFEYEVRSPFEVPATCATFVTRCDMETDGGGWMVIQRRIANGNVNFTRDWDDYVNGFGDLDGEFWYGLDNIHYLTTRDDVELRIDMVMEDGSELSWTYQTFTVAGADDKYRLTIGGGVGTGGYDAMDYHNGQQFTTYDNDNDQNSKNCGYTTQGGWWYKLCYRANLNGPHDIPSNPSVHQTYAKMMWFYEPSWRDVSGSEMKIRQKQCI